jgi:hypothetical protein
MRIEWQASLGFALADVWLVKTLAKRKVSVSKLALGVSVGLVILAGLGVSGFNVGRDSVYSPKAKLTVQELRSHLKQINLLKKEISNRRQSFREPTELLQLEPDIDSWNTHVQEITRLLSTVDLDRDIPPPVSRFIDLITAAVAFDKRELENIALQLTVVRSLRSQETRSSEVSSRTRLDALMEQEYAIDREREAFNFPQRAKQLSTP